MNREIQTAESVIDQYIHNAVVVWWKLHPAGRGVEEVRVHDGVGEVWSGQDFSGDVHGSFTDEVQKPLDRKVHEVAGDVAKPIVPMSFNAARPDGYNLALRIRHAGYTNVYWYRGGREAWEVAGKPEDVVRPAEW